jgi:hypothetical protein
MEIESQWPRRFVRGAEQPSRNPSSHGCRAGGGGVGIMIPTRGLRGVCCASPVSGAAMAPTKEVAKNSRRFMAGPYGSRSAGVNSTKLSTRQSPDDPAGEREVGHRCAPWPIWLAGALVSMTPTIRPCESRCTRFSTHTFCAAASTRSASRYSSSTSRPCRGTRRARVPTVRQPEDGGHAFR